MRLLALQPLVALLCPQAPKAWGRSSGNSCRRQGCRFETPRLLLSLRAITPESWRNLPFGEGLRIEIFEHCRQGLAGPLSASHATPLLAYDTLQSRSDHSCSGTDAPTFDSRSVLPTWVPSYSVWERTSSGDSATHTAQLALLSLPSAGLGA